MLRALMSVFDPLGFLAPFTVRAKILLQDVWRRGTGWDEQLHEDEQDTWVKWVAEMSSAATCRIPRCYFFKDKLLQRCELHTFCDASEKAYATVAYLRVSYNDGSTEVKLIRSKSLVAPLKPRSIPRLELQAALIGARLAKTIVSEHNLQIDEQVFWTDSKTVLCWLKSDPRNYQVFVANRLGELDELTNPDQWRWVPTKENPADDATKDNPLDFSQTSRWINGPSFLVMESNHWPTTPTLEDKERKDRVNTEAKVVLLTFQGQQRHPALPEPTRFIRWYRLLRATARVLSVAKLWRNKATKREWKRYTSVSVEDMKKAKVLWYQEIQRTCFPGEQKALHSGKVLPNSSKILHLLPFLDSEGVIRARGRVTDQRYLPTFNNTPPILDGRYYVTRLFIQHYHSEAGHVNSATVLNEINQEVHILGLRRNLRSIISRCILCRLRRGRPLTPLMGDLPPARTAFNQRPFTHCGLDYFGPMTVTIGRRREKRWGALFTCLTTRAVHLELASSLSTDSAIMAVRRMAARRGQPEKIFSDNATNFVGADTELKSLAAAHDRGRMQDYATSKNMEWKFIPPAAPHMGGAWESLGKSVTVTQSHPQRTSSERRDASNHLGGSGTSSTPGH